MRTNKPKTTPKTLPKAQKPTSLVRKEEPKVEKKTISFPAIKVSAEERQRMVQENAYYIAEKDGFQAGQEGRYWIEAEAKIDALLNKGSTRLRN